MSSKEDKSTISLVQLKAIMPNAPAKQLNSFLAEFNSQLPRYQITTPLRIAAFIAQGAHESGELKELIENMNYSAPRIIQVWPSRFHTLEAALPYEHQPEKLGNNVYANRMGNGGPESGDGYRYRGRGWFNGTGKVFYKKMAKLTAAVSRPDLHHLSGEAHETPRDICHCCVPGFAWGRVFASEGDDGHRAEPGGAGD